METKETIYQVPVFYEMCEYVFVKADSPRQAKDYVDEHKSEFPIHPEKAYYVDDSFTTDDDVDAEEDVFKTKILGYNGDKVLIPYKPDSYTYYDATR